MSDKGGVGPVKDRRHPSESSILDHSSLDPSKHYRFIQSRPTSVARAKLKGYRIVKPSEEKIKTLFEQEDADAKDIIKHGDRILMAVPKREHKNNQRELRERAIQRLSADKQVRDLAEKRKVKVYDKDEDDD